MTAPLPLFNRREVVAIFVDVDDATAGLPDLALPDTVAPHASASYAPPRTRLEVMREALVAFVGAKLRSTPSTSLLTFGLYAVTAAGSSSGTAGHADGTAPVAADDSADAVTVRELLAPASAGAAGGRAMQAAIKHAAGSAVPRTTALQSGATAASPAAYTSVVRTLQLLQREAAQAPTPAHPRDSPPASTNASFAATRSGASFSFATGLNIDGSSFGGGPAAAAGAAASGAVVVHGILLRSRQTPLGATPAQTSPVRRAGIASEAAPTTLAVDGVAGPPRCWLDIVTLSPLADPAASPPAPTSLAGGNNRPRLPGSPVHGPSHAHDPSAGATTAVLRSSEVRIGDGTCACAVLDPVELTGIAHRGLALGPALTRLISLQERRTAAFVRRPLVLLDLSTAAAGRAGNGSGDAGAAVATTHTTATAQKRNSHVKQTGSSDSFGASTSASATTPTVPAASAAVGVSEPLAHLALPQLCSIATAASSAAHGNGNVGGGSPGHAPADAHPHQPQHRRRSGNATAPSPLPTVPPALSSTKLAATPNRPPPTQPPPSANPRKASVGSTATSPPATSSAAPSSGVAAGAGAAFVGGPSGAGAVERHGNGSGSGGGGSGGWEPDRAVALRYCAATTSTPEVSPPAELSSPPLALRRAATAAPKRSGQSPVRDAARPPPQHPTHPQPPPPHPQVQSQPLERGRSGGVGVPAVTPTGSPEQLQRMPMALVARMASPLPAALRTQQPQPQQQPSPHPPTTMAGGANAASGVRSNLAYRGTILGNRAPLTTSRGASPSHSSNGSGPGA